MDAIEAVAMATFIDPRGDPKPPQETRTARTTDDPEALIERHRQGVMLCLWAGADPHAPAPSLRYPTDVDEDNDECDEADRFLGWPAVEEA